MAMEPAVFIPIVEIGTNAVAHNESKIFVEGGVTRIKYAVYVFAK